MVDEHKPKDEKPVIRDKRRLDPETGAVRNSEDASPDHDELIEAEGPDVETSDADALTDDDLARLLEGAESGKEYDLASERLADLQRLQAEYANYRKRVERDRAVARELAIAEVLTALLPALDDLALAEAHGDLVEGPMALIAQKLKAGFDRFGIVAIGEKGEPFDPNLHEALMQQPSAEVTVATITDVLQSGYQLGDRLIRAAKVAVAMPAE